MFAAVNLFGYVPGILSVSIIVIIEKSIISFGIYLFFWHHILHITDPFGKMSKSETDGRRVEKICRVWTFKVTIGTDGKNRRKAVLKWCSVHDGLYYRKLCERGYSLYARLCDRQRRKIKGNQVRSDFWEMIVLRSRCGRRAFQNQKAPKNDDIKIAAVPRIGIFLL